MTDRTKDVLAILLILASVGLLARTYASLRETPTRQPSLPLETSDDVSIPLTDIFSNTKLTFDEGIAAPEDAEIFAIFLLKSDICTPCLNEVHEYLELISRFNTNGNGLLPLALIFEEDSQKAVHFVRTSALPISSGYGYSSELAQRLAENGGKIRFQQLVFVDKKQERLFYRITLLNKVTPIEEKERGLERAMAAYRSQEELLPMSTTIE